MGEQFVVGLQGAEPFGTGNGIDERAQQGRLPSPLVTGDDDRLACEYGSSQQSGDGVRHHSGVGQLVQGDVGEGVVPDDHRGSVSQSESNGMKSVAITQGHRHRRVGVVEGTWRCSRLTQESDCLHEFLVAVGHWRVLLTVPVTVLDVHWFASADLDVLGLGDVEEGLQSPVTEYRVGEGVDMGQFLGGRPQRLPVDGQPVGVGVDDAADDGAAQHSGVLLGELEASALTMVVAGRGDASGGFSTQFDDHRPVDSRCGECCGHRRVGRRRRWSAWVRDRRIHLLCWGHRVDEPGQIGGVCGSSHQQTSSSPCRWTMLGC